MFDMTGFVTSALRELVAPAADPIPTTANTRTAAVAATNQERR
jgi:hypothetical protein